MNYICSKCCYVYYSKRVASLLILATRGSNKTVLFAREYSQQTSYVVTVSAWSLKIFNAAEWRPHSVRIYYMFELKLGCGAVCAHTHVQESIIHIHICMHIHTCVTVSNHFINMITFGQSCYTWSCVCISLKLPLNATVSSLIIHSTLITLCIIVLCIHTCNIQSAQVTQALVVPSLHIMHVIHRGNVMVTILSCTGWQGQVGSVWFSSHVHRPVHWQGREFQTAGEVNFEPFSWITPHDVYTNL